MTDQFTTQMTQPEFDA